MEFVTVLSTVSYVIVMGAIAFGVVVFVANEIAIYIAHKRRNVEDASDRFWLVPAQGADISIEDEYGMKEHVTVLSVSDCDSQGGRIIRVRSVRDTGSIMSHRVNQSGYVIESNIFDE